MMAYHHRDLRFALIEAASALVAEGQGFDFSLREVARRAGVSHNAPYKHFADKRELMGEVAASGFRLLYKHLLDATENETDVQVALLLFAKAYLSFARVNPALYRLMLGPHLAVGFRSRPGSTLEAGELTKTVLIRLLRQGASDGSFAIPQDNESAVEGAHLAIWAMFHGLASLVIDEKAETEVSDDEIAVAAVDLLLKGLFGTAEKKGSNNG